MKALKEIVKKMIPPLLICIYREREYSGVLKTYRRGMANIKKNASEKVFPRVVFIVQFPEVWNSILTVYKALESAGAAPLILCVPKPAVNYSNEYAPSDQNEAFEFLKKMNIPAVNAYEKQRGKWFDLKIEKPDYVIYTRPYNEQYPELYKSICVCSYAKVCYIPYAYSQTINGLSYTTFNYAFILTTYLTFAPSQIRLDECRKRFALQDLTKSHKFIFRGFPRFDLLTSRLADIGKTGQKRKIILWLPRWTVDAPKGQRMSSFFRYLDCFFTYMAAHPMVDLIIRPHPLMFKVMLEKNIWTQKKLDELLDKVDQSDNICFDQNKDYLVSFGISDILVSDYSSLLIEYFISGKPIIYCDTSEDFNADAMLMDSTLYHAEKWQEVESLLTKLINEEDFQYEKRNDAVRRLIPSNAGHIGDEIANYILEDFRLAQKKDARKS